MHVQAQVDENLAKQAQVMQVIEREQAAYKQAFGFNEWRSACEVRPLTSLACPLTGPPVSEDSLSRICLVWQFGDPVSQDRSPLAKFSVRS